MAIYKYTDNGITFDNLNSSPSPKKVINGKLVLSSNDFEYANEDGIKPIVNAVEIDWNGAQVTGVDDNGTTAGTITVSTTGELLSIINKLAEKVNALQNGLAELTDAS